MESLVSLLSRVETLVLILVEVVMNQRADDR